MNQFLISPEDCLILRAYQHSKSLREAAQMLNCDPAGLQRKTQRISDDYGYLQKIGGRWGLTPTGVALVGWLEESIRQQFKLLQKSRTLQIVSTAWLSEQLLVPNVLKLRTLVSRGQSEPSWNIQITTPDRGFESALIEGACDFVIVCHAPEDPSIAHRALFKEEWVAVAPASWKGRGQHLKMADVLTRPFIRHKSLNPDTFRLDGLAIEDNSFLTFDNLISIRAGVASELGWSVVPKLLVHDVLRSKKVQRVQVEIPMDRRVCVWWLRNRTESKRLANFICQFVSESDASIHRNA